MTKFEITVLGCGSAMPTTLHHPPSQLIDMNEKLFMAIAVKAPSYRCGSIKPA